MTSLSRRDKGKGTEQREIISRDLTALTDRLSEISRRRRTDELRARLDNYFTLAKIIALIAASFAAIILTLAFAIRLIVASF
jgi:hypothetical protein